MRTTVKLAPDLAQKVKALARRRGMSIRRTLNELIRRGLSSAAGQEAQTTFTIQPHESEFRPGVDAGKLNQLVDQLEVDDFFVEASRSS